MFSGGQRSSAYFEEVKIMVDLIEKIRKLANAFIVINGTLSIKNRSLKNF
jgi:hypothetical protein